MHRGREHTSPIPDRTRTPHDRQCTGPDASSV
ncbi:hypothetical protein Ae406Ps2_4994c [Pseudonocardia sp. Ae406_Ps2]|nr:hypothetical protein Ae331Ps2_0961 [Pseudonocardia sp. Ae331_Ps2]OLL97735.1 hypothetical protein Ae331Ps2_1402 [Pseudonocardia sp. Ae331_Ps2]OLM04994.1 hypothetical protein Ae406Ps2_4994c [Pseudonocardia sp. Ae406_Ps2]OLM26566.1 hypothetical protein Ae706Ps2_4999c [Pseudonocardia sp. Ae706_Ps2]